MTKWEIERRTLLKTLGVGGACLPLLRATKSYAQAGAGSFPLRLFVHLQTEGYRQEKWQPPHGPLTAPLPSSSAPLEPYKQYLIFLANLGNPQFRGCGRWGHGVYGTIFAQDRGDPDTGNGKEYWEPENPTFDQVVATSILQKNPQITRPSIAMEIGAGGAGRYLGSNRCYWKGAKQPVTPESNPYTVYDQIFAGKDPGAVTGPQTDPAADRLRAERKSLLDYVGKDLERFRNRLGSEDRMVIDGHLQSVRELESQLAASPMQIGACGGVWSGDPSKPVEINTANTPLLWPLHQQLLVQALKCDVTRVATTQVGDATGGRIIFDFVPGVPREGNGYQRFRDWHDLGHRPVRSGAADGDDKAKVDKWTMERFADLLKMMTGIPEGTGTMLDNTVVLWGNHMEDGASHGAVKIPWIIAGSGQGYFKTGQAITNTTRAVNGPMREICAAMGVQMPSYGAADIGGEMKELQA